MHRQWIGTALVVSVVLGLGLSACAKKTSDDMAAAGAKTSGKIVAAGSVVSLQYTLSANNQPVVPDNAPQTMKIKIGQGKLPALLEKGLIGLPVGAAKAIALKPEEAYGPERKELVGRVPRSTLPAGELKEGTVFTAGPAAFKVVKIMDDGTVIVDRNHPLAGKYLVYKVRVASIE